MDIGTKIRTIARFAVSAYTAFCVWQTVVDGFGNKTVSLVWAVLIILFGWLVDFATTWYNNDFTEAGSIGTGVTRQIKKELEEDYVGDRFFTEAIKEVEEEDEHEDNQTA